MPAHKTQRVRLDSPAGAGRQRYRNAGHWADQDGKMFNPKQHYYVGGNTKVYGAVLFRFRERDFGAVHQVDGVSPGLAGVVCLLRAVVRGRRAALHGARPVGSRPHRGLGQRTLPVAGGEPRAVGIVLDEGMPERSACIRCATCDGFACLVKAKSDAQVVCVEPALRHPNVTLLTHARVRRLETSATANEVTRVLVERDGQSSTTSSCQESEPRLPVARSTPGLSRS
jgi:choline dehydrogenase-like flavoprotein